jgi:hypothetical protein
MDGAPWMDLKQLRTTIKVKARTEADPFGKKNKRAKAEADPFG